MPNTGPDADPCDMEAPSVSDPQNHVEMLVSLFENEEFKSDYINRYADLNNTYFSCDYMIALLDELIDRIAPEMPAHIDRWGGSLNGWENNVEDLKDYILSRCTVVNEGIVDCYEVEGPFELTIDVEPAGTGNVELNKNSIIQKLPLDRRIFWGREHRFGGPTENKLYI